MRARSARRKASVEPSPKRMPPSNCRATRTLAQKSVLMPSASRREPNVGAGIPRYKQVTIPTDLSARGAQHVAQIITLHANIAVIHDQVVIARRLDHQGEIADFHIGAKNFRTH